MTTVGVVGLGAMGGRMAGRLIATGHEVHGTNRTAAKARPLIDGGLRWHDTPREVARAAEVTISMVTDDDALRTVASGPDGILAGLSPGKIHIEMSSVSPRASIETADRVRAGGARMLDAPVSGSVPQAERGTLTIMAGGDETAFHTAEPVLRDLGDHVIRVGDSGQGTLLKMAVNLSLATQLLAFSEGLRLAEAGGMDPETAIEVMSGSAIGSPLIKGRAPLLLHLPEETWFPIRLLDKDIHLALDQAQRSGTALPTAATAAGLLRQAIDAGYGDRDVAALHQALVAAANATEQGQVS